MGRAFWREGGDAKGGKDGRLLYWEEVGDGVDAVLQVNTSVLFSISTSRLISFKVRGLSFFVELIENILRFVRIASISSSRKYSRRGTRSALDPKLCGYPDHDMDSERRST